MSKKLLFALGAFALGIGTGVGLKALLDQKRKCCIDAEKDGEAIPVPTEMPQTDVVCVCEEASAPDEDAGKEQASYDYDQIKDASENPLEVPIGINATGNTVYCDLAKMPHLLLAGMTGSGKSVTVSTILTALAEKNFPEDLRFLLIDPKQLEFANFADLPYLYAPIVTESCTAAAALCALVEEMERRFEAMKNASVRDLVRYNEKMADMPEKHMPYIVVALLRRSRRIFPGTLPMPTRCSIF